MQPKIYPADEHEIDPSHIDADALTVLTRLRDAGHVAYLVGGGVRDLLVKKRPKDFDISTSASPEEIKRLFHRQCVLIGRRFRLAHVRFGQKILEVSTFRSGESGDDLILRDNQWGTPEEDAKRRDFTINGLFLDPTHHQVIDYVGGWSDIHAGILRTIGDPTIRFKQDPVRMIRLIKFIARFGFNTESETKKALTECKREILKSAPARILEELLRMLESGASKNFIELLENHGLLALLLPWLSQSLLTSSGKQILLLLQAVDEKIQEGKFISRDVAAACLLYPILDRELHLQYANKGNTPNIGDIATVTHALIRGVSSHSFPPFTKRMKYAWNFILSSQYRFQSLSKKAHPQSRILRHPDFPAALSLLELRAKIDDSLVPLAEELMRLNEQNQGREIHARGPGDSAHRNPHHKPRFRNRPGRHAHGH